MKTVLVLSIACLIGYGDSAELTAKSDISHH